MNITLISNNNFSLIELSCFQSLMDQQRNLTDSTISSQLLVKKKSNEEKKNLKKLPKEDIYISKRNP